MKYNDMTLPQLLEAIEQYFECALTDEQEKELRHEIAVTSHSHPSIDEAKAIMGIQAAATHHRTRPYHHHDTPQKGAASKIFPILSMAASLALIITLGILFARPVETEVDRTCIAYVNGKVVTDEEAVFALMAQNIDELHDGANDANEALLDDLGIIAPVVDKYDSEFDPFDI
ncbi:MAG: hypothetical protein K2O30_06405 [Duncaniella sp.]|nr:hypothetical protein [Duncaniella sp.]